MEKAMKRDKIDVNDRQLACAHINSAEGQDYLKGMASAATYAWVNRSSMTFLARQVSPRPGHWAACTHLSPPPSLYDWQVLGKPRRKTFYFFF